jgi:hypothetical protein
MKFLFVPASPHTVPIMILTMPIYIQAINYELSPLGL